MVFHLHAMGYTFEIINNSGRIIHLSQERWTHITIKHPYMSNYLIEVKETIKNPHKIVSHEMGNLFDYYSYYKHRKGKLKFLKVVVKYLNGSGFILSAYFVGYIN